MSQGKSSQLIRKIKQHAVLVNDGGYLVPQGRPYFWSEGTETLTIFKSEPNVGLYAANWNFIFDHMVYDKKDFDWTIVESGFLKFFGIEETTDENAKVYITYDAMKCVQWILRNAEVNMRKYYSAVAEKYGDYKDLIEEIEE